jgi:hypothetical protein
MRPLAEADLRTVLGGLSESYAQGRTSDFHVYAFKRADGSVVRGNVAGWDDPNGEPGILVNSRDDADQITDQVTIGWDDVQSLVIESG